MCGIRWRPLFRPVLKARSDGGASVTIYEILSDAEVLLISRWRETRLAENEKLYRFVLEAGFYIWRTGQIYRFEDYLQRPVSERIRAAEAEWPGEEREDVEEARAILSQLRDDMPSEEEKHLVQVIIDRFGFIHSMGQCDEFSDYLATFYRNPEPVIAHFDTRAEAEAWLENLEEPPSSGYILLGEEYHEFFYSRERGVRGIRREYMLERFIESTTSRGLPEPVATFDTRAEAEAWWANQPTPPYWVYVKVAGEHHLAVHHRKIDRRTLHPLSILEGWEEEKKRIDELAKAQREEEDEEEDVGTEE
jgi:hypothetical protein